MNTKKISLYEQDFYLWLEKTSQLLRNRKFAEIDVENLIEEIEAMGRKEKRELISRLTTIIEHLLKLIYWTTEKDYNQRGWINTIMRERREIDLLLNDSPSLKQELSPTSYLKCYQIAKKQVEKISGLSSIPNSPNFNLKEVLSSDWLPFL